MRNTHRGQRPFVTMAVKTHRRRLQRVLLPPMRHVLHRIWRRRGAATAWFGQRKMVYGGVKFVNDDQFHHVTEGVNVLNPARQFTPVERVVRSLKAHRLNRVRGPQFMSLPESPTSTMEGLQIVAQDEQRERHVATVAQNIKGNGPLNQVGVSGELLIKPRRA